MPVADQFWGNRYGVIEDPFAINGRWPPPKRQMTTEDIREAARNAMAR